MCNYDFAFDDVIHTSIYFELNLTIFLNLITFLKELFQGSWKLKRFFQYLKYGVRYDILNVDKFVLPKREGIDR